MKKGTKEGLDADKAIGQRLRMLRNAAGVSQEDLAGALGISFQQVQKYERGINRLGVRQVETVMAALHCSASDLIGSAGETSEHAVSALKFMATRDGLELAQAYHAMPASRRAAIISLIRAFA